MMNVFFFLLAVFANLNATSLYRSATQAPLVLNERALHADSKHMTLRQPLPQEVDATRLFLGGACTTVGLAWLANASKKILIDPTCPSDRILNGIVEYVLPATVVTHGLIYSVQAFGRGLLDPIQKTIGGMHLAFGVGVWGVLTTNYFFRKEPNKILGTFLAAAPFVVCGLYDMQAGNGSLISVRF